MNNKSKILIVDDQLIGRQLLESILFKEEYELFFAEDGEEALEQTITHKPDLVLLDVMMPKIDGFEVCRRIRKDKEIRDTPVIMVTALDDRDSRLMGFDAGANDYVSKPIDRQELLARVKNITDMNRFRKLAFFDESTANTEESDIQPSKAEFKDSAERIEKLHHFLKIKSNENPALFFKLFSGLDSSRVPEFRSLEKHGEMLGMYVHPQIEYMPEIALLSEIAFYQLAEKYTEKGPDHLLNGILETLNQWANEAGVHLDTSTLPLAVLSVNRNQRLLYLASRNVFIWKKSGTGNDVLALSNAEDTTEHQSLGRAEDLLLASGAGIKSYLLDFYTAEFWQEDNFSMAVSDNKSGIVLIELI